MTRNCRFNKNIADLSARRGERIGGMRTGYIGTRKIAEEDCKRVYTLNTWTDDLKATASRYLEDGYWVYFGSTAIGHTRARFTEADGLNWAKKKYEGILRIAEREEDGYEYCQLV